MNGVDRFQRIALVTGLLAFGACLLSAAFDPAQFYRSYLFAWFFWAGISLGCLGVLMLQHLSGGRWGFVIRRVLEAGARTIPLVAVLFVPVIVGLKTLYVWARPEAVAEDALLQHKSPYLNVPFFLARAAVYFAVWGLLAWLLTRWSARQDETGDEALTRKLVTLSGPGLGLYVLTMTFASVDWIMSLEPEWFSTLYGGLIVAGQALGALAFAIAVLFFVSRRPPMSAVVQDGHFHDLGKLLLAFVMVWSYFAFSQFLIIWAGNLPEEIPWYLARLQGGWQWVALALVMLQFAAPFLLLLSRGLKRNAFLLARVAIFVVLLRLVDLHWMTMPAFSPAQFSLHWLDVAAPAGVGGLWLWAFAGELRRRPLVPQRDPYFVTATPARASEVPNA